MKITSMKIGLQTWGSHGDIRPFIALAEGLYEHGHDVTLGITCVDSDRYNSLKSKKRLKFVVICSPVITDQKVMLELNRTILNTKDPVLQLELLIKHLFISVEQEMFSFSKEICENNDLVIGHTFLYPLKLASEIYQKPIINIFLAHYAIPSAKYPPDIFPNIASFLNRFFWKLVCIETNRKVKKYPDNLYTANNFPKIKDFLKDALGSKQLNIIAISNVISGHLNAWPDNFIVSGFLDTPNIEVEGNFSDELINFLDSGDEPIFFTIGSMMPSDINSQKTIVSLVLEALNMTNARAIIQSQSWKDCGFAPSEKIFFLDKGPHKTIFPRCKAVIHHGGAGTTHTATALGVPSIILYTILEQKFWGKHLKNLGISPGYCSIKEIKAKKLSGFIKSVLQNSDYKTKALLIAEKMNSENGVENIVNIINSNYSK